MSRFSGRYDAGSDAEEDDDPGDLDDQDFDQETFDATFTDEEMRLYAKKLFSEAKKLKVPQNIQVQSNYWTYTLPLLLHTIVRRRTADSDKGIKVDMRELLKEDMDGEEAWREMKDVFTEFMECLALEDKLKSANAKSIDSKLQLPLSTGTKFFVLFKT
jgi:hypothetical protein